MLGAVGYIVAVSMATMLTIVWQCTLGERLVVMFAPPLARREAVQPDTSFRVPR